MGRKVIVDVASEFSLDDEYYKRGFEAGVKAMELDFTLPANVDRLQYYKGLIEGYVIKNMLAGVELDAIGVDVASQIYNNNFPLDSRLSIDEVLSFNLPEEVKNAIAVFVETVEMWGNK